VQRGAAWCSVVQCGAVWCSGAVWYCVLQCVAVRCSALQFDAVRCSVRAVQTVLSHVQEKKKRMRKEHKKHVYIHMLICTHIHVYNSYAYIYTDKQINTYRERTRNSVTYLYVYMSTFVCKHVSCVLYAFFFCFLPRDR